MLFVLVQPSRPHDGQSFKQKAVGYFLWSQEFWEMCVAIHTHIFGCTYMDFFGGAGKYQPRLIRLLKRNCWLALRYVSCYAVRHMSVTSARAAENEQYSKQIDRLVNSHTLHGSESLCRLLRYLAVHALEHPGAPLKEYQIATEVFGRPADFDPQLDSTIRVQAGRLRVKLAEYYANEGASDSLVVELPKGTYVLNFHSRTSEPDKAHRDSTLLAVSPPAPAAQQSAPKRNIAVPVLMLLLGAAVAFIVILLSGRGKPQALLGDPSASSAPASFQTFWRAFISGPEEPWVIFSNGAFIGRPETGMRYFNAGRDDRGKILDHYTGVGEVLAVHELDRVFNQLHHDIRVKRGSLLSLDDAKNNNLIFVGSPAENLSLLELPGTQEFIFQRLTSGPRKGDLGVVNVHPQPGEAQVFLGSPGPPLSEDYAVVALVKGINPGRSVMILAGTTTIGTQAAVEYVCRQNSLEELLLRLSVGDTGEVKPFEAVLRVKVTRGVPVETQLVALRKTG